MTKLPASNDQSSNTHFLFNPDSNSLFQRQKNMRAMFLWLRIYSSNLNAYANKLNLIGSSAMLLDFLHQREMYSSHTSLKLKKCELIFLTRTWYSHQTMCHVCQGHQHSLGHDDDLSNRQGGSVYKKTGRWRGGPSQVSNSSGWCCLKQLLLSEVDLTCELQYVYVQYM